MRRNMYVYIFCALLFAVVTGCGKSGDNSSDAEAGLSIAINPDPGTSVAPALSANYAFTLLINSVPPKNGVKIMITGTKDSDNSLQFSQTSQTASGSVKSIDLGLSNLVSGILYNIKIDVTSQGNAGNKASLTFKVARK